MKWRSHLTIAKALAQEAGLPPQLEKALCDGCVEPDIRPDSLVEERSGRALMDRMPHHGSTSMLIRTYVWKARLAFLSGNDYWCMKCLGRALHYLQDKSVSVGFLGLRHDHQEKAISQLKPDPQDIRKGMDSAVSSPYFVNKCLHKIKPQRSPEEVMRQATYYSAALMACVIDNTRTKDDFWVDYLRVKRVHWLGVVPLCLAMVFFCSWASLLTSEPIYIIFGAIFGVTIMKLDSPYYRLRAEAEWFNLH